MLCPVCGSNVGDSVRLCEKCAAAKATREETDLNSTQSSNTTNQNKDAEFDNVGNHSTTVPHYPLASLWFRFLALGIDSSIIGFTVNLSLIVFMFIGLKTSQLAPDVTSFGISLILVFLIGYFIFLIGALFFSYFYYSFFESSKFQATPGKIVFGLAVTNINRSSINFYQASLRYIARQVPLIVFIIVILLLILAKKTMGHIPLPLKYLLPIFGLMGCIYALVDCPIAIFTEHKQSLHDIVSNCLVVQKQQVSMQRILAGVLLFIVLLVSAILLNNKNKENITQHESNFSVQQHANFYTQTNSNLHVNKTLKTLPPPTPLPSDFNQIINNSVIIKEKPLPTTTTIPPESEVNLEIDPKLNYITTGQSQKVFKSTVALYYPQYNRLEIGFYTTQLNTLDRDSVYRNKSIPASVNRALPGAVLKINFKTPALELRKDNIKSLYLTIYRDKFGGLDFPGSSLIVEVSREDKSLNLDEITSLSGKINDRGFISGKFTGQEKMTRPKVTFGWNLLFSTESRVIN